MIHLICKTKNVFNLCMKSFFIITILIYSTEIRADNGNQILRKDTYKIKPFGNLSWDDGLWEVLCKVKNEYKDLKYVNIWQPKFNNEKDECIKIDLANVNTKEELEKKLDTLITGNVDWLVKTLHIDRKRLLSKWVENYIGYNETQKNCFSMGYMGQSMNELQINGMSPELNLFDQPTIIMELFPVGILGVPFSLKCHFRLCIGLDLINPSQVLYGEITGFSYPLVLFGVTVESNVRDSENQWKNICKMMYDKYSYFENNKTLKNYYWDTLLNPDGAYDGTIQGQDFLLSVSIGRQSIIYMSVERYNSLNKKYQEFLKAKHKKENKELKDYSSGL